MTKYPIINAKDLSHKKVCVRVDFNCPLQDGVVSDDTRVRAALPTIEQLLGWNCSLVLMSHLGRPKGTVKPELSLKPVAKVLEEHLKRPVIMAQDCIGDEVQALKKQLKPGDIVLLENLRFHPEEKANEPHFAQQLAQSMEDYVNDAFGTAHRAHASTVGITRFLPSFAGKLLERELTVLGGILDNPTKPMVTILGGAKVSDKLQVLKNLIPLSDSVLIGGGMAFTFLKAQGYNIGSSLCEADLSIAHEIFALAQQNNTSIHLPKDVAIAPSFAPTEELHVVDAHKIPDDYMGLDIGPQTAADFRQVILDAGTVLWNGPMGVFEMPPFDQGTRAIAEALKDTQATTVVGGGDSGAAITQMGFADHVTHLSTGGGACLEFLEGKQLPGVQALLSRSEVNS